MDFKKQFELQGTKKAGADFWNQRGAGAGVKKYKKETVLTEEEKKKKGDDYRLGLFNRAKSGSSGSKVVIVKLWEAKVEDLIFKPDGTTGGMIVKRRDVVDGVSKEVDEVYQFPIVLSTMMAKMAGCGQKFDEKDEKEKAKKSTGQSTYDQFKRTCLMMMGLPLAREFVDADPTCVEQQQKSMVYWKARTDAILNEAMTNPNLYSSIKVMAQNKVADMKRIWDEGGQAYTPKMLESMRAGHIRDAIGLGWKTEHVEVKNEEGVVTEKAFFYQIHQSSNGFRANTGSNLPQEVLDASPNNHEMADLIKQAYQAGYQLTSFMVVDPNDEPIARSLFEPPWANESYIIPIIKISWYNKEGNQGCTHHFSKVCVLKEPEREGAFDVDLSGNRFIAEKPRSVNDKHVLRLLKAHVAEADGVTADELTAALITKKVMTQPDLFKVLGELITDRKIKFGKTDAHFKLVSATLDIDRIPDLPVAKTVKPAAEEEQDDAAAMHARATAAAAGDSGQKGKGKGAPTAPAPKRTGESVLAGKAKKARPVTDDDDDDQ